MEEVMHIYDLVDSDTGEVVTVDKTTFDDVWTGRATVEWLERSVKVDYGSGEFYFFPRPSHLFNGS